MIRIAFYGIFFGLLISFGFLYLRRWYHFERLKKNIRKLNYKKRELWRESHV